PPQVIGELLQALQALRQVRQNGERAQRSRWHQCPPPPACELARHKRNSSLFSRKVIPDSISSRRQPAIAMPQPCFAQALGKTFMRIPRRLLVTAAMVLLLAISALAWLLTHADPPIRYRTWAKIEHGMSLADVERLIGV